MGRSGRRSLHGDEHSPAHEQVAATSHRSSQAAELQAARQVAPGLQSSLHVAFTQLTSQVAPSPQTMLHTPAAQVIAQDSPTGHSQSPEAGQETAIASDVWPPPPVPDGTDQSRAQPAPNSPNAAKTPQSRLNFICVVGAR